MYASVEVHDTGVYACSLTLRLYLLVCSKPGNC